MKRIFYILLILEMSGAVLFASSDVNRAVRTKTLYPLPSAIVMKAYRYLGRLQAFSVDAVTTNDDVFQGKILVTYTHWVHIDLQRPGKLYIKVDGDLKNKRFYLNNGDFTIYDKDLNYYGKLDLPKKIDAALDALFEKYDIKTALANILYSDLYKRIPPQEKGYYFGLSDVEDTSCYHLAFANAIKEIQVWIEKGERPLIRKFIVIDKTEPLLPRSSTVLHWKLKPHFGKKHFMFAPPENAWEIPVVRDVQKEKK